MKYLKEPGVFCEIYGVSIRNRILEFILVKNDSDFAVSDIPEFLGISKPKAYEVIYDFEEKGYIIKTRLIGKTQLYKLNTENPVSKIFIRNFKECLMMVLEEYKPNERLYGQEKIALAVKDKPKRKPKSRG
jgi:hypothetical protein